MEETKDQSSSTANKQLAKLLEDSAFRFFPELGRVAYVDPFVTIYPIQAVSANEEEVPVYSYIGIPA